MKLVSMATLALALALASASTLAADAPAKTLTPQQQRMKDCNTQATGKKGEERRAFMSTCLKGPSATPASSPSAQATPSQAPVQTDQANTSPKKKSHHGSDTAH